MIETFGIIIEITMLIVEFFLELFFFDRWFGKRERKEK